MQGKKRKILCWIPGSQGRSRSGISLIFTVFFYLYGLAVALRAGTVSGMWHGGDLGNRLDLAGILVGLCLLYLGSVLTGHLADRRASRHGDFFRRFQANRMAIGGLVLFLAVLCGAVLAPLLTGYDPTAPHGSATERYASPSIVHPMGTDKFGRDILSRVLYGARASLSVGVISVVLAALLGTALGAVSGYLGGWIDDVMMRIVDGLLAFPRLLIVLTLVALFSNSFLLIIAVIAATGWMGIARLVRAQVLALKRTEFIQAAVATGLGRMRIIWKHLVPNSVGPVFVAATLRIGGVILLESYLSFLGLGVQPPIPSWGGMAFDGREVLLSAWWVSAFPALAIVAAVVSCNLLGDGLRDAMDVRTSA